jgi:hypothetical protein
MPQALLLQQQHIRSMLETQHSHAPQEHSKPLIYINIFSGTSFA